VGCYIWYSEEEPGRGRSPPRPLLAVPNVTAHPSTASVQITVLLYNSTLLCGFNVAIKVCGTAWTRVYGVGVDEVNRRGSCVLSTFVVFLSACCYVFRHIYRDAPRRAFGLALSYHRSKDNFVSCRMRYRRAMSFTAVHCQLSKHRKIFQVLYKFVLNISQFFKLISAS